MPSTTIETLSATSQLSNPGGNSTSANIVKPVPISGSTNPMANVVAGVNGIVANGDGVFRLGDGGEQAASAMKIRFFGVGSDTNTGLCNVYGWGTTVRGAALNSLWVPTLLASFSFELDSGMPGVAGTLIPANNLFATAITLITGNSGISVEVVSPGHGNDIAHVVLATKGAKYIEFRYGLNNSSTSLNADIKRM